MPGDGQARQVEAAGPLLEGGALAAGVLVVDLAAVAVVDGGERLDGLADLGRAKGELLPLHGRAVHGGRGEDVARVEMQHVAVGPALDAHAGPGGAAVAVLERGDDVAAGGEAAEVGGVVGAGRGHAVRKDHDGEAVRVVVVVAAADTRRHLQQRGVDLGGDLDAAGDGPEEKGEDGADEEVVGVGEARKAGGGEGDGPRDPEMRRGGGAGAVGDGVVEAKEDRLEHVGGLAGGAQGRLGELPGHHERHLDVDGADVVRRGAVVVGGQVGSEERHAADGADEGVQRDEVEGEGAPGAPRPE